MYEVEAKVRLSENDFKRVKKELPKIANKVGKETNTDHYSSDLKNHHLRVRDKNGQGFIHIKSKTRGEGIEANQEVELKLTSGEKFKHWLGKMGINLGAQKVKESVVYKKGTVRFELNEVKGLGYFLEIEIISGKKEGIPKAKKQLIGWFEKFGFGQKDFERKYYLELLEEIRKT